MYLSVNGNRILLPYTLETATGTCTESNPVKDLIAYKNHFRRVRKIEKSDYKVRHVPLSAGRVEQLGSHWRGSREF